nr:4'-phosphopantetheinyl transferase superfamily protein [Micromonospora sp. DSM 115978]
MIETVLPAAVVAVEAFGDDRPGALFPAEAATLGRAVEKRRNEFTTGRLCAHQALSGLGVQPVPILPGKRRAPIWPTGVVGSITHCAGYRAAAVAHRSDVVALGIDAEPNDQLPAGVLDMIAVDVEREWLAEQLPASIWWDRLLFSAKEAVFKAWYPLTETELDFDEAALTVDPDQRTFTAHLLVPGPVLDDGRLLTDFTGRWVVQEGLVVTAVTVLPIT